MAGTNQFGPYYDNTGTSSINPWGFPVPGVNNPVNTNVPQTVPNPPQGGINNVTQYEPDNVTIVESGRLE